MIGFEITINNNRPIAIASDSSQLFLTTDQKNIYLFSSGIDRNENRLKWADLKLNKGDRLTIKVKELDMITPPLSIEKEDINYLKETYYRLKAKLEKKGLI
ncbi:hypothetical protein PZ892_06580 [Sphingobacterium sp. WM]|uniref:hypothetical protein n=1 Tax=Sphingobacterium sp. WM TaxID=3031802 RepID=UPI00240E1256|nr:hypothetical protein [Sphingobacterium sp. WM]WFB64869.1 hypothetical protein PZ892_06580 [Sphingobacterium sp. WM]